MMKPTETFKKFQVFGKNCKNFKVFGKICKNVQFLENVAISQGFGKFFVATDLILKHMDMFRD